MGQITIPAGAPADTWARLMPIGNNGAKVPNAANQVNIGPLREDLFPRQIVGWRFKVLTEGYLQENQIDSLELNASNEVILNLVKTLYWHDALPDTGIEWIIFPLVDFKFGFSVIQSAPNAQVVQLGLCAEELYSPEIKQFWQFPRENYSQHLYLRTAQVDKIFYRFAVETSGTNILAWGEYEATRT